MEHSTKNYCIVGGGSGGHIIPGLTIAENYKQIHAAKNILFVTSASKLDAKIINSCTSLISQHIPLAITAPPLQRPWKLPFWTFKLVRTLMQSYSLLQTTNTDELISTGGFVSVPVVIAARLLKIPITLYELNVEPGKATKFLTRFATTINITFNQTQRYFPHIPCTVVEYPLRKQIKQLNKHTISNKTEKTLLILGGSQGSISLNNLLFSWIMNKSNVENLHIIHQTGSHDTRNWNDIYTKLGIKHTVFAFHDALEKIYPHVDYIICRAGAGTLFEVEHLQIQCLMIPLETSYTSHQTYNAQAMAEKNPALFHILYETTIRSDITTAHETINTFIS